MEEAPQVPRKRLLEVLQQQVPIEDRSPVRDAVLTGIFAILCFEPALIWPDRGFMGYGGDGWMLWPAFLLTVVLSVCMLDDHLERSPRERVLAVLLHLGTYLLASTMFFVVVRDESVSFRAAMRSLFATLPLHFALGSSRTLVKWKHRSDRIRHDPSGSPYLQ